MAEIPVKRSCLPRILLCWISIAAAVLVLSACSKEASGNPQTGDAAKRPAVPVTVSEAVEKEVPVEIKAIGNVQAYATVSVQAQVPGELLSVHFKEGQEVKKGDLLFSIDPSAFEARLRQAEANLAKSRAQLQNAKKQAERYGSVVKKGYVSEEQYDQIASSATVLEAAVKADEAAVESAKLDLKYCAIRSPMDGSTGQLKVHPGNLVKVADSEKPMVVINGVSPVYVTFSVPEQNLPELKRQMTGRKLQVSALVPGEEDKPVRGELSFLDNTVDPATGTIQLKATFNNADRRLWPGQFVNVVLVLSTQSGIVVVPSRAVQTGQQGQYVYVVKDDLTVEYRPVTAGRALEGETVIEKGLSPGDKVVTDGQLRLAPGASVKIAEGAEKGAPKEETQQ